MGEFEYTKAYKQWKWSIPKNYNIGVDVIDRHAASKNRNKLALLWENAAGATERYTFGDLKFLTNKFGNVLKNLGFVKGDRFLIRLPNIPAFQVSFLGGVKIGAVPIPSSVMFREHEIEYRINDSNAKAVITTPKFVKEVHAVKNNCKSLEHVIVVGDTQDEELSYDKNMKESSVQLDIEPTKSTD